MVIFKPRAITSSLLLLGALAGPARAQWAVIDAPAIAQLIQEVQTMQEQLATACATHPGITFPPIGRK
jgi:hypothetical protein